MKTPKSSTHDPKPVNTDDKVLPRANSDIYEALCEEYGDSMKAQFDEGTPWVKDLCPEEVAILTWMYMSWKESGFYYSWDGSVDDIIATEGLLQ